MKGKATLEREIFEGINGEGFDEVDEFIGDPMMFLFMLLLCCSIWISGTFGECAFEPIHYSNFAFKE